MNETQDTNVVAPSSGMHPVAMLMVFVLALLSVGLGLAWYFGWYPFAGPILRTQDMSQVIDSTTARGGPTLNEKQINELVKNTTSKGTSTLTKSQEDALVKATSVQQ